MGDAKLVIVGDAKSGEAAIAALERREEKLNAKLVQVTKQVQRMKATWSAASKAQTSDTNRVRAALAALQTPAQQYRETVKQFQAALQSGSITKDQYNKLIAREAKLLRESSAEFKRTAAANARMNEEGRRIRQAMLTPSQRLNQELARLSKLRRANAIDEQTYRRAVQQTHAAHRAGNPTVMAGLKGIAGQVVGLGVSYLGVSAIVGRVSAAVTRKLQKIRDANQQIAASIDEVLERLPEEQLKLQIQAELSDKEIDEKLPKIKKALLAVPSVDLSEAFQLETQLASSGFSKEDRESGAALQSSLRILAATNQFGGDVSGEQLPDAIKSLSQFLKSQGETSPSADSIERVGAKLTALFKESDIQFPDLSELARVGAVLKGLNISEDVQLASFSAIRDILPAAEGRTAFRQVALRLRGVDKRLDQDDDAGKKAASLAAIGLKPADVDLIGEDFPTALKRLNAAFEKTTERVGEDEGQRLKSAVLGNVFGERGAAGAASFLTSADKIDGRLQLLTTARQKFDKGIETFSASRTARNDRLDIRKEAAALALDAATGKTGFREAQRTLETVAAELAVGNTRQDKRNELATAVAGIKSALEFGAQAGLSARDVLMDNRATGVFDQFGSGGLDDELLGGIRQAMFGNTKGVSISGFGAVLDTTQQTADGPIVNQTPTIFGNAAGTRSARNEATASPASIGAAFSMGTKTLSQAMERNASATERNNQLLEEQGADKPPRVVVPHRNAHTEVGGG